MSLLAPSLLGVVDDSLAIDSSVNTVTPLHNAMLITECRRLELRDKFLKKILLVRRWAKERAVSHCAKVSSYLDGRTPCPSEAADRTSAAEQRRSRIELDKKPSVAALVRDDPLVAGQRARTVAVY